MSKKVLFTLEYPVRCSPGILYEFLRSPSALQEWFADKVDEKDGVFSFSWNGTEEKADLLADEMIANLKYNVLKEAAETEKAQSISLLFKALAFSAEKHTKQRRKDIDGYSPG